MNNTLLIALIIIALLSAFSKADLPVHCVWKDLRGTWEFSLTDDNFQKGIMEKCTLRSPLFGNIRKVQIALSGPNVAVNLATQETGTFTLIYDQGFEVTVGNKKYFAYFNYTENAGEVTSYCYETMTGWYHDTGINPGNWGCYRATKVDKNRAIRKHPSIVKAAEELTRTYKNDASYIEKLNKAQNSWTAAPYKEYEGKSIREMIRMKGYRVPEYRRLAQEAHMKYMRQFEKKQGSTKDFPAQFDWTNKNNQSYVSPVRNQGSCGSCYAFAATAMYEARVRVQTNNARKPIYSPQDIVSCTQYAQGCLGGFPYLISAYGKTFGINEEQCYPYLGKDTQCSPTCQQRTYIQEYNYVGGYYGASTEENMMEDIIKNGPMAVSFMVYRDFIHYKEGIYHHVATVADPDPHFELTNHVVLIVGWGEKDGQKYWKVKNSWGEKFGLNGYFLIRKGNDECAIESMTVTANGYLV